MLYYFVLMKELNKDNHGNCGMLRNVDCKNWIQKMPNATFFFHVKYYKRKKTQVDGSQRILV